MPKIEFKLDEAEDFCTDLATDLIVDGEFANISIQHLQNGQYGLNEYQGQIESGSFRSVDHGMFRSLKKAKAEALKLFEKLQEERR